MTESQPNFGADMQNNSAQFDDLLQGDGTEVGASFSVGFRGYDRNEVDRALADLQRQVKNANDQIVAIEISRNESLNSLQRRIEELTGEAKSAARLEAELARRNAQLRDAEERVDALSSQLVSADSEEESATRDQFEAILRVAEEQADVLIKNATSQTERMLQAAKEDVAAYWAEAKADAARLSEQSQNDAEQVRLRIETEYTAHEATLSRESAHAAEKVAQADREAEAVRTEAEKGAAALRAMVTRETEQLRADAERDVREMNARVLEFEETLTRRQDDAQQEFLVLHNQAVAHAERITSDANDQVASSLEHAQLISRKADDYEKLMRAQASQLEAESHVKAQEMLDRARTKAKKIVTSVTDHTNLVLRDAEDRARQLRWQQQQLNSFMAEVRELIRPEGVSESEDGAGDQWQGEEEVSTDVEKRPVEVRIVGRDEEIADAELQE